jgi:D-sedoheptulose 7-phosphate isomerase
MSIAGYLQESISLLQDCIDHASIQNVERAIAEISRTFDRGKPLLVCGNGGSASDASHIAGELVGRFLKERRALNCICLSADSAVLTAWANDYAYETVFSRQVEAYGAAGGTLLGLSTSGNSKNVVEAFKMAKSIGMTSIAMTGEGGGALARHADILIDVPSRHTPLVQQAHACLYHYICERVEAGRPG